MTWQRETIVGSTCSASAVTSRKYTCAGGSSRLLSSLLAAAAMQRVGLVDDPHAVTGHERPQAELADQALDLV